MDEAEYIQTQQQLLALAGIVEELPLEEFLQKISICETVSPFLDPTLYMKGADKLTFIKQLARSAKSFQTTVVEQKQSLKAPAAPERSK